LGKNGVFGLKTQIKPRISRISPIFFVLRCGGGSGLGLRFTVDSQQLSVNSFGIRGCGFFV
jgi:hypothetical protein